MRINITRIEAAILAIALIMLIALAVAPAWWGRTSGQEVRPTHAQNATNRTRNIGDGQTTTIQGIVIDRD